MDTNQNRRDVSNFTFLGYRLVKILIGGLVVIISTQLSVMLLFYLSGLGFVPLGLSGIFALSLAFITPGVGLWIFFKKELGHSLPLIMSAGGAFVLVNMVLYITLQPGKLAFNSGFRTRVLSKINSETISKWMDLRIETNARENGMNLRVPQKDIPSSITSIRRTSIPTVYVMYDLEFKRYSHVRITWREAFSEWGVILTRKGDTTFDDTYFKVMDGVYLFDG